MRMRGFPVVTVVLASAALFAAPLAADPPVWEFRVAPSIVKPKARVRDGELASKGDSVFSGTDLDVDAAVPSVTFEAAAAWLADRVSLSTWRVSTDGSGALPTTKSFAGQLIAAGTLVSSELEWSNVRLQYLHTFVLAGTHDRSAGDWLFADVGLAVDRTTFRAKLDFPGGHGETSLRGLFPTPQAALEVRPFDPFALRAGIGGFHAGSYRNGETDVIGPLEYRLALRGTWERWSVEAGYYLYHVHFEENRDDIEEDVVHMRLRSVDVGVVWRF